MRLSATTPLDLLLSAPIASCMDKMGKRAERDWQKKLTPEQYEILRLKGTEAPFTGQFVDHHEDGSYACAACGNVLFQSNAKYDSHCGWPSFYDAKKGSVESHKDASHGTRLPMPGTGGQVVHNEVTCSKCGGHLGHLFEEPTTPLGLRGPSGPKWTGQRYCINSASLDFKAKK